MTNEERIAALKAKHASLEAAIEEENSHLRPDDMSVSQLKRRKLRIKDELALLSS